MSVTDRLSKDETIASLKAEIEWLRAEKETLMEARAKIERLTADLDILKRHYNLHPDAPLSREETLAAKDAKIERLRALVEECLRYIHNDFEPDNQSAVYYRIRRALEGENER